MIRTKHRLLAVGAIVLVGILPNVTSIAATSSAPGSITLLSPKANDAVSGNVAVDWKWKGGKTVKSSSRVDLAYTADGVSWTTIAASTPIRTGSVEWPTRQLPDRIYAVRAVVRGTSVKSVASPIKVDNTAPVVDIISPAPVSVVVDGEPVGDASVRYIIGTAKLEARAEDLFSGVTSVHWMLDDAEIGEGATLTHNFGATPGPHTLSAMAEDAAGNQTEAIVDVIVAPGPSTAQSPPTVPTPPVDPTNPPTTPPTLPVDPDNPPTTPPTLPVDPDNPPTTPPTTPPLPVDPDNPPPIPEP